MTNDEIDTKVLDVITRRTATRAGHIQTHIGLGPDDSRIIDRSLQRLRKAGRIEYLSPVQGWGATKAETP
jgi:hypothetical protein